MSNKPVFVFVHGAWHGPSGFDQVRHLLEAEHSFTSLAVSNPSTAGDASIGFKDDVDNARAAITAELGKGHDVIVVAHSYGGFISSAAIKGLTQPKSSKRSEEKGDESSTQGHVIGLVLIASFLYPSGRAFLDNFPAGEPPAWWQANRTSGFADLQGSSSDISAVFYNDLPADVAASFVEQLRPQTIKALYESDDVAYAGWMDIPTWYITATEDQAIPIQAQQAMIDGAIQAGGDITSRELKTSHSSFLSQPGEVVKIIIEAASVFEGGK
jgi:pimeloyl-ACP methyl ester carboxylesterase